MGAEFTAAMSDGGSYTFEHDVTRIVAGDPESARARLADALEQMGYRVLDENPLQARRSARGRAATGCSTDILDYSTSLNIGLKSAGPNSTRVTFDYVVKQVYTGYLSKGDRHTLTREAEAVIALATARAAPSTCAACGAEVVGGSRFCRQCGAPKNAAHPAEMEVLRLTAGANASYKNIAYGAFFIVIAVLLPLILFFLDHDHAKFAKRVMALSAVAGSLGASGLIMLLMGLFRLRKLAKPPAEAESLPLPPRRSIDVPDTAELPPQSIQHSVTEATTDLLSQKAKRMN
ncbi:MAG: zinc ribbon domain-containing protein [Blastocatellia bacterium]